MQDTVIPASKKPPTLAEVREWPATVAVSQGARALGISGSLAYELIRKGEFPVRILTLGSSQRVVTASLIALLEEA
ncbi:DNA-binding protein [Embleya sp. NPDC059237]|uniref:DNA-binding protein n=1 Tax=Embleya sp. NPDC059237 TaxID=3346784 RepID=UPI00369859A0